MSRLRRFVLITPGRLAGLGCLVVMAVFVAAGLFIFQQIQVLLPKPQSRLSGAVVATQDVQVKRGTTSDVVRASGVVAPVRDAQLFFASARGRIVAVNVKPGATVRARQVLLELDVAALERDLAKAQSDLQTARSELEDLTTTRTVMQKYRLEVDKQDARAALDRAQRELDARSAAENQREQIMANLAAVRADFKALGENSDRRQQIERLQWLYNVAEARHGQLLNNSAPTEMQRDQERLEYRAMLQRKDEWQRAELQYTVDTLAAGQKVALAERALRSIEWEMAAGSLAVEQSKRQAAVKVAEATVKQIEAKIDSVDQKDLNMDVARAQASIIRLEGVVAENQAALAEARLTAPFDGVIDEVRAVPEDFAATGATLITMVDNSALRIIARINEVDLARLKPGKDVQVTFDAFRGRAPLLGLIGEIPPFGTYQSGITVFDVPIEVETRGLSLKLGMTVNITIPVDRSENVLVVPAAAVLSDEKGTYVRLVQGKEAERRQIVLGVSDGVLAEIVEGLSEGDVVRVPLQGPITTGSKSP